MLLLKSSNVQGRQIHKVFDIEVRVNEGMVATLTTTSVRSKHLRKQRFPIQDSGVCTVEIRNTRHQKS